MKTFKKKILTRVQSPESRVQGPVSPVRILDYALQTLGLTGYISSDANKRLRDLRERCKINRKLIKQDTISRSKQDLFREVKIYFVLLRIFSPFSVFK